jgi:hypothetical protein
VGQGKERRNKVITGNEEVAHTNTLKGDSLAGTSTEDAISKRSQATFIITSYRRRDLGSPRRRLLVV